MRATFYIKKKELENYLLRKGYILKTIRRIILEDFGFNNTNEIRDAFPILSSSVLNIKVAYKTDEDREEIVIRIASILDYLRIEQKGTIHRIIGRDILFYRPGAPGFYRRDNNDNTLYLYTQSSVFRREILNDIKEKTKINEFYISI